MAWQAAGHGAKSPDPVMKPFTPMILRSLFALVLTAAPATAAGRLDLSGSWRFALDAPDLGSKCQPEQWKFPDVIKLPGILTAQGLSLIHI